MLTIQILPSTITLEALQSQPQFHPLFILMPLQLTMTSLKQIFSTSTFIQYSLPTSSPLIPECMDVASHSGILNSLNYSKDDVYSALGQLDPNKATGIDTISPRS